MEISQHIDELPAPAAANDIVECPVAICLASGRTGCDAQMIALAHHLSMRPVVIDGGDACAAGTVVLCTGPERSWEAVTLARRLGVPVVGLGDPGEMRELLDLVIATPQFPCADAQNLTRIELAISPHGNARTPLNGADVDALLRLPRPMGLFLVGGPAYPWQMDRGDLYAAITAMSARCASIVVLTSRRTPPSLLSALKVRAQADLLVDDADSIPIRLTAALSLADEVVVTGDSVSMISEAIQAGLPTAVVELHADKADVSSYLADRTGDMRLAMPGHLHDFWKHIKTSGPLAVPSVRPFVDPLEIAASAVSRLLIRQQDMVPDALAC